MPEKRIKYQHQLLKGDPSPSIKSIIGRRFGRLLIESYAGHVNLPSGKSRIQYVWCLCDCGSRVLGNSTHIKYGNTISCGCWKIDHPSRLKHGYAPLKGKREKIYKTWQGIHKRCRPGNSKSDRKYYEKGIKVCDGWSGINGFENFKKDMMPITGKSLDRINNDLHYSCGNCDECKAHKWGLNCRWADDKTQSNNRGEFNNWVEIDGKKMTFTQASRYLGFNNQRTLQSRVKNLGWSIEKAMYTPIKGGGKRG